MKQDYKTVFLIFYLAACGNPKTDNGRCIDEFSGSYSGVALATEGGDSSFATSAHCPIFITGNEDYYQKVREAWRKSPYQGDIRPVYVEIQGNLYDRRQSNLAPLLKVGTRFYVSTDLDPNEVAKQFRLRMDRDAPIRSPN